MAWTVSWLSISWLLLKQALGERHTLYWNSSNIRLQQLDYTLKVKPNDYLDINCPHYQVAVAPSSIERYILYLVDQEDYESCEPKSKDQIRWECKKPHALHGPERFSEKFQRYTPFSLGKEFRPGHHYYYISKPVHHHGEQCLRMKIYVCCKRRTGINLRPRATQPSLAADEPGADTPSIQRSTGSSTALVASQGLTLLLLLGLVLL